MHSLSRLSRRLLYAYLITLIGFVLLLDLTLLYPRQAEYVGRSQSLAIGAFRQYLELESKGLLASTEDYAFWDDLYAYALEPNPEFVANNFTPPSLATLRVDAVLVTDRQGWPLISLARHPKTDSFIPFEALLPSGLFSPHTPSGTEGKTGWLHSGQEAFLVAAAPILDTQREAKPAGTIYFFRRYSNQQLIEFGAFQGLVVSPEPFRSLQPELAPLFAGEPPDFHAANEHLRFLADLKQRPSLLLRIQHSAQPLPARVTGFDLLLLGAMALFPFLGMLLYRQLLIKPVVRTIGQVGRRDSQGAPVMMQHRSQTAELRLLVDSYNELVGFVQQDRQRLQAMASTDSLTGLLNRRAFDRSLLNACQRSERLQQPMCLALLDVDYFKQYNDHYGHPAGDEVLRRVAELLRQLFCRATDRVGRYGGEEFILLLEAQPPEQVAPHLENLRRAVLDLAIEHRYSECAKVLSISIGAVQFIPSKETLGQLTPEHLLHQADQNLYRAKQQGRNRLLIEPLQIEASEAQSPAEQAP